MGSFKTNRTLNCYVVMMALKIDEPGECAYAGSF